MCVWGGIEGNVSSSLLVNDEVKIKRDLEHTTQRLRRRRRSSRSTRLDRQHRHVGDFLTPVLLHLDTQSGWSLAFAELGEGRVQTGDGYSVHLHKGHARAELPAGGGVGR